VLFDDDDDDDVLVLSDVFFLIKKHTKTPTNTHQHTHTTSTQSRFFFAFCCKVSLIIGCVLCFFRLFGVLCVFLLLERQKSKPSRQKTCSFSF